MEWIVPSSEAVTRYAYDREAHRLYIDFKAGAAGFYEAVTPALYLRFHNSASKGTFIGKRLRNNRSIRGGELIRSDHFLSCRPERG
jgi:hypothetical protein